LEKEVLNLGSFVHVVVEEENRFHVRKVYTCMNRIAFFINSELSSFGNYIMNRKAILEKLMTKYIIRLHLPPYYLPPNEAKA
jgi:hypothetical protein